MNGFREEVSCLNCKHNDKCKLAQDIKVNFGLKLKEMCFYCFDIKNLNIIENSFNNNSNYSVKIG